MRSECTNVTGRLQDSAGGTRGSAPNALPRRAAPVTARRRPSSKLATWVLRSVIRLITARMANTWAAAGCGVKAGSDVRRRSCWLGSSGGERRRHQDRHVAGGWLAPIRSDSPRPWDRAAGGLRGAGGRARTIMENTKQSMRLLMVLPFSCRSRRGVDDIGRGLRDPQARLAKLAAAMRGRGVLQRPGDSQTPGQHCRRPHIQWQRASQLCHGAAGRGAPLALPLPCAQLEARGAPPAVRHPLTDSRFRSRLLCAFPEQRAGSYGGWLPP